MRQNAKAIRKVTLDVTGVIKDADWIKARLGADKELSIALESDGVADLILVGRKIKSLINSRVNFDGALHLLCDPNYVKLYRNGVHAVDHYRPKVEVGSSYVLSYSRRSPNSVRIRKIESVQKVKLGEYSVDLKFVSSLRLVASGRGDLSSPDAKGVKVILVGTVWTFHGDSHSKISNVPMSVVDGKLHSDTFGFINAGNESEALACVGME